MDHLRPALEYGQLDLTYRQHMSPQSRLGILKGRRVTLRAFAKAEKTLVDGGQWSDKRMPKTGGKFPLSKSRNFRVGASGWRWRVVQLEAGGRAYRVLIMYHLAKQNYLAVVGTPVGSDLLVLGVLEHHATHPGWHVHASCKPPGSSDSGRMRYDSMRKASSGGPKNEALRFPTCDRSAFEIAKRYLRLPPLPDAGAAQLSMLDIDGGVP